MTTGAHPLIGAPAASKVTVPCGAVPAALEVTVATRESGWLVTGPTGTASRAVLLGLGFTIGVSGVGGVGGATTAVGDEKAGPPVPAALAAVCASSTVLPTSAELSV